MIVNPAISLIRHIAEFDSHLGVWRCNILHDTGGNALFATTWGETELDARSKANSIIEACAFNRLTEL